MKRRKQLLGLILAFCFAVSCIMPIAASAAVTVPKFDPNGGSWVGGGISVKDALIEAGVYVVPDSNPTYSYREFKGWFSEKYIGDVPDEVCPVELFEEDHIYYAGWKSKEYDINYFNLLPGADNSRNPKKFKMTEAAANPIILYPASKEGYGFDGWHYESGGAKVEQIDKDFTTSNYIILDASWFYKLKETVTGYVGTQIRVTLALADGSIDMSGCKFSVASGYTLPDGLTLDSDKGVISGTPTTAFSGTVKLDINPSPIRTDGYVQNYAELNINITNAPQNNSNNSARTFYNVKFESNGGTAVETQRVRKYSRAEEPTAPTKDDCEFDGWYSNEALTEKFDFSKQIVKNITLYAKWTAENDSGSIDDDNDNADNDSSDNPFDDVTEDDWFYDDVMYVNDNGLMNGISNGVFAPNEIITRGMFVTVLYRMEGRPEVEKTVPFEDIDLDAYYADAVIWAKKNGIVKGISETEYAPNDNVLREQIAAIMLRYARYKGIAPTGAWAIRLEYTDADQISDYAVEGVMYCTMKNIMQGKADNKFAPKDSSRRAEIAAILRRFIENNK